MTRPGAIPRSGRRPFLAQALFWLSSVLLLVPVFRILNSSHQLNIDTYSSYTLSSAYLANIANIANLGANTLGPVLPGTIAIIRLFVDPGANLQAVENFGRVLAILFIALTWAGSLLLLRSAIRDWGVLTAFSVLFLAAIDWGTLDVSFHQRGTVQRAVPHRALALRAAREPAKPPRFRVSQRFDASAGDRLFHKAAGFSDRLLCLDICRRNARLVHAAGRLPARGAGRSRIRDPGDLAAPVRPARPGRDRQRGFLPSRVGLRGSGRSTVQMGRAIFPDADPGSWGRLCCYVHPGDHGGVSLETPGGPECSARPHPGRGVHPRLVPGQRRLHRFAAPFLSSLRPVVVAGVSSDVQHSRGAMQRPQQRPMAAGRRRRALRIRGGLPMEIDKARSPSRICCRRRPKSSSAMPN